MPVAQGVWEEYEKIELCLVGIAAGNLTLPTHRKRLADLGFLDDRYFLLGSFWRSVMGRE
jgi:hypothetical protein